MAETTYKEHIFSVEIIKHKNMYMILSSGQDKYLSNRLNIHMFNDLHPKKISSKLNDNQLTLETYKTVLLQGIRKGYGAGFTIKITENFLFACDR